MSCKVILLICISFALGLDFGNISPEEALKRLSKMKDEISINLTDENFETMTQAYEGTGGDWFVYFYTPTCQSCNYFNPTYRMLAKLAKDEKLPVSIGKIDASKNPETAARFRVGAFPTLLYFRQGRVYNYTGSKDEFDMMRMMKQGTYTEYVNRRVPDPRIKYDKSNL